MPDGPRGARSESAEIRDRSSAQAELADERAVALEVPLLQVVEQPPALADEHEQAAARVVVLLVLAQVLGEVVDALGEQGDLDAGIARVLGVVAELGDQLGLALLGQRHAVREGSSARTSSTSCVICSTSASTEGKRRSPRSRLRKRIDSSWPYRSPSKSSR